MSNCPTQCLKFGEEADFKDVIAKAEVLMPEAGTKPRVYYLNLPKKFIAGTVYDPGTKDVVVGATCTLTGEGQTLTAKTNDWGDFKFDGLKVGKYYAQDRGWRQDQDGGRHQHTEGCGPGRRSAGLARAAICGMRSGGLKRFGPPLPF